MMECVSRTFLGPSSLVILQDDRIQDYVAEVSNLSKDRKAKSRKLREAGKQNVKDFGFTDGEIENIFDLIEEEHPDL